MKALVTGANGFLGKYIVEHLIRDGWEVRTINRRADPALSELAVEQRLTDIRERDQVIAACDGVETVFHVAGVAGIWGSWDHYFSINTLGTNYIIEGCQRHNVPKLVYTSSPSVVFDGTDHRGVDESVRYPQKWLGHYSHSKALAEQAVLEANNESLFTCSLRPHLIWGPRDNHLIPRLIQRAKSGRLRQVGDGTNLVDNIYVSNASDAHLLAVKALQEKPDARGRAYFISQGTPVNCWDWINEILALAGQPSLQKKISYQAAYLAGSISEFVYKMLGKKSEPMMTRFLAGQLAKSHYFDVSASRELLGFEPSVSHESGMQRLQSWMESAELCESRLI